MKKISLNISAFNKGEVLTRAQLKKVMGGDGSGEGSGLVSSCSVTCPSGVKKDKDCGNGNTCKTSGTKITCGGDPTAHEMC